MRELCGRWVSCCVVQAQLLHHNTECRCSCRSYPFLTLPCVTLCLQAWAQGRCPRPCASAPAAPLWYCCPWWVCTACSTAVALRKLSVCTAQRGWYRGSIACKLVPPSPQWFFRPTQPTDSTALAHVCTCQVGRTAAAQAAKGRMAVGRDPQQAKAEQAAAAAAALAPLLPGLYQVRGSGLSQSENTCVLE